SWTSFARDLSFGPLAAMLAGNPGLAHQVAEPSKIASQPEAQRFSIYSEGGGPGAIFGQAEKIFCHNMTADPGSIPIINTYFLHPPRPGRLPDGPAGACLRPHIQAAGRRDGGGYRPATGRVPARARRDRLV